MTATEIPVDNGVNVEALLGVREALAGTSQIAQFQWRSTVSWVNGTHSRSDVETFYGFGEEQQHHTRFSYDVDHPLQFAARDNGVTPVEYVLVALGSCLTAGVAAVAQQRSIQLRSVRPPWPPRWTCTGFSAPTRMSATVSAASGSATRSTLTLPPGRSGRWSRSRRSGRLCTTSSPARSASRSTWPDRSGRAGGAAVRKTTTVIIGAGHCGLAMSHCLAARSVDHVVLERAEIANSWRTQRWDSLRLLTPNWMTRLPGCAYRGADPDGYLSAGQVAAMLADYAGASAAPVLTGVTVTSVRAAAGGFTVRTAQGTWHAPTVVLACGAATLPAVPSLARLVPAGITSVTPAAYRNPGQLPGGGVLVIGASASGIQLADELHRSGRPVTLAVGETSACRAPTAAGTSCGGWTPPGCWTSATTRPAIWSGRGTCRPCS
jgi:hypothetical protein